MTPDSNRPDLRQMGQSAFTEVLWSLLSLPATACDPAGHSPLSAPPDQITSRVSLAGPQLSGSVHVQLPLAFVSRAVHLLTGFDAADAGKNGLLDDTAGELANMVAGRLAALLAVEGYHCTLGTPSVSRSARLPIETPPGAGHGRTDLLCEGHRLSLEIQCCYPDP